MTPADQNIAIANMQAQNVELNASHLIQKQEDMMKITYALYAVSLLLPIAAIAGLIIAYIKKDSVSSTYLESHYRWLISTFWWSLLISLIGIITLIFGVGIIVLIAGGIWYVYRVIKGFIKFNDQLSVQ